MKQDNIAIVLTFNPKINLKKIILGLIWLSILMIFSACSLWSKPQVVSRPPQTPMTAAESLQLWQELCRKDQETGCLSVTIKSQVDLSPVPNALVIIDGQGGMAGRTNQEGEYRWSQISAGLVKITITVFNNDSTIHYTEERDVDIISGTISDIEFIIP
jgi:hypothetical protein